MLLFRMICAVLMAWAVNWVLSRPEALPVIETLPVMAVISPIAGAMVGFFNLASRQGWGLIVAVANGVWAGILSILVAGTVYALVRGFNIATGPIDTFDSFVRNMESEITPLFDLVLNFPLLTLTITATAVLGVATEMLHWALVKLRKNKEVPQDSV
ncbi:MAG: hypothetical protein RQ752_12290 [Thermohalobaculum sp.]|nr:hypothetical protein [Thermohalobaculum sp.]